MEARAWNSRVAPDAILRPMYKTEAGVNVEFAAVQEAQVGIVPPGVPQQALTVDGVSSWTKQVCATYIALYNDDDVGIQPESAAGLHRHAVLRHLGRNP